ncbi:Crotonyl-CoA carboxylase/reductase, ethylmalonyl-CoA producing [invertebrate metagenome]|uniref:Crotonyl-CoA carboxylase/reductase, ethylmalonyl-CoA producing n=1 Tax=invertebrate metagenome TaxID=1711999 RepID=A0A484HAM2_9ZZZZ
MTVATSTARLNPMTKRKDLYAAGEIPPIGHLPTLMHAFAVRQDRHGEPLIALQEEIVPTPIPDSGEVVIMVMATGVSMHTIWSCLGIPTTPFIDGASPYHIPGSDCAGVVWAVGADVTGWRVGEEVVVYPVVTRDSGVESIPAQVWGYETANGALAQFARVRAEQLLPRPLHLTWAESACHLSVLATAYRMLFGYHPHVVGPGQAVLVWDAARGLGAMAVQLVGVAGATAVAVVGNAEQAGVATQLGAVAALDHSRFEPVGPLAENRSTHDHWRQQTAAFIAATRTALGKACGFDIVFESLGQSTFPLSCQLVRRCGMVVFCSGTTDYTFCFDARPAWRKEIRLQGSHLASKTDAAAANRLVHAGSINPCLAAVFDWQEAPVAHTRMLHGVSRPGNMAVLVQSRDRNGETGRWEHKPPPVAWGDS